MTRAARRNFEALPVSQWTADEAYLHLDGTFSRAAAAWPDLMERYVVMLADATDDEQRRRIMRVGLRETVAARYGGAA